MKIYYGVRPHGTPMRSVDVSRYPDGIYYVWDSVTNMGSWESTTGDFVGWSGYRPGMSVFNQWIALSWKLEDVQMDEGL